MLIQLFKFTIIIACLCAAIVIAFGYYAADEIRDAEANQRYWID
jgi:hypothetical protein